MRTALDIATEFAPDRDVDLELVILRHMEHHMEVERLGSNSTQAQTEIDNGS